MLNPISDYTLLNGILCGSFPFCLVSIPGGRSEANSYECGYIHVSPVGTPWAHKYRLYNRFQRSSLIGSVWFGALVLITDLSPCLSKDHVRSSNYSWTVVYGPFWAANQYRFDLFSIFHVYFLGISSIPAGYRAEHELCIVGIWRSLHFQWIVLVLERT